MSKNETYFIRFIILLAMTTTLYGEITIGLLTSITNNAKQTLLVNNVSIECIPFGIIPLDEMAKNGASPEECRQRINEFYQAHPYEKYFSKMHLHLQQSYHFEKDSKGCILYANGLESLSEMLLRRGLARITPTFDVPEWNVRFKNAQNYAQQNKIGMYETLILKYCILEEK